MAHPRGVGLGDCKNPAKKKRGGGAGQRGPSGTQFAPDATKMNLVVMSNYHIPTSDSTSSNLGTP